MMRIPKGYEKSWNYSYCSTKAKRRGIQKEEIEDAVINPAQVVDRYGGRKVIYKKFF